MNTLPSPPTQAPLVELDPDVVTRAGPLRVLENDGQRAVFLGATCIETWEVGDKAGEAAALAFLARSGVGTHGELAALFGCHRNRVGRLKRRLVHGGMAEVVPAQRGPKAPHKVTAAVLEVVREQAGLGRVQMARVIEQRTGVRLHARYVGHLLRRVRAESAVQGTLAPDPAGTGLAPEVEAPPEPLSAAPFPGRAAAPAPPEEAIVSGPSPDPVGEEPPCAPKPTPEMTVGAQGAAEPPVELPDHARVQYLGAALYYPALRALGLLEAAATCFRLPKVERFGVRAVMLTLFFLSLLSKTTVEAAKHLRRWEFGPLVGTERAPVVKTLRRKLGALVKQGQASRFGVLLARRWVEQGVLATAYLYVDGHVKVYTGKRKLAECWNSQRRMPLPGVLSYWVNDQQGRPVLFVTEEANASLAQAMPRVVGAIREVVGQRPFTVIFDRGGYDGKLFGWLTGEGIDFITYQKGEPDLPKERFQRRECRFEGRRVRMWLAEDAVSVGGSGPWRRIVVRTENGHQTPILTSLKTLGEARIACLMFARWRQENFFKYSTEHQGLDQLVGYAWAEADGTRLVPNPERKRVEREIGAKRQDLARKRSALGQTLLDEPRSGRTAHGLKVAQGGSVGAMRALQEAIKDLEERRATLPKHVPLAEVGRRDVLRLEQKAIVDRIKMTAYNAEEWMLDLLVRHYPNPHDVRDLLRSFARLAGELHTTPARVVLTLDAPDLPLHRQALRGLCADLNQLGAPFPGTDLPVTYQVAMHHSEVSP